MKIFKKNQITILVISLMLIVSGYLNFTNNYKNVETSTLVSDRSDENIGDAQLVSTIPSENEEKKVEELASGKPIEESKKEETEETNSNVSSQDDYFISSKLDRNTMYSETLETYQEIYNNSNSTAEQKKEAMKKINEINNNKNAIMIAENLIIAKGFDDVVIFVNDGSISVVIRSDKLKEEQVAQIQNIVSRELNVNAEKIHISNK